eukprot:6180687-Pleurochrysis_carterae.AAC.1
MLRRTFRASKSLRTSRIVARVRARSPVAPFITNLTSRIVLMRSLRRRTTAQSFSATSESPKRAWTGSERLNRVKAWCSALNSMRDASVKPVSWSESIIDLIARPAEGEEALASAIEMRIRARPLFWHWRRYAGRVAGDAVVLSMVSMSCRSTLANCSGEITKRSGSSVVRACTLETEEALVAGAAIGAAAVIAALAGVERVVGLDTVAGAGVVEKVKVGTTGEGESIVYGE